MDKYKATVTRNQECTKGTKKTASAEVTSKQLIGMILDMNGGGYTEEQTAKTMEDMDKLLAGETVTLKTEHAFYTVSAVKLEEKVIEQG